MPEIAHTKWTRLVAARTRRRRFVTGSATLALTAMLLLVVQFATGRGVRPPPRRPVVATLASATGPVIVETQPFANDVPTPSPGAPVRATRILRTNRGVFAALTLVNGASVRVDESTRLRLLSPQDVELFDGRIYVERTSAGGRESAMQVRTALGEVRDLSARFEVHMGDGQLRVRVRDGEVLVNAGGQSARARGGTDVHVAAGHGLPRTSAASESDWSWVARSTPGRDSGSKVLK